MAGNTNDAEDLLQDIFLLAFRHLKSLREADSFGGWIKRIAINECIRVAKKKKLLKLEPIEEPLLDNADSPGELLFTSIRMDLLIEEIEKLPDLYRQVFNLYAIEGFGHAAIAQMLASNESTIRSYYHRAKAKLRSQIEKRIEHG